MSRCTCQGPLTPLTPPPGAFTEFRPVYGRFWLSPPLGDTRFASVIGCEAAGVGLFDSNLGGRRSGPLHQSITR
jgi:hypothetical protein